ncbi:hypothetical protein BpHYR1_008175 [Brachionus plicatilis]|uniref:Uncharacterized protein n=1 Tax=Brachionus plicatilis TaxID=10195 RepID=A0A3M7PRJ0_BRAPC|nr:hypothetical protein BpHYR1_008175 [Brachionus plicatilis]
MNNCQLLGVERVGMENFKILKYASDHIYVFTTILFMLLPGQCNQTIIYKHKWITRETKFPLRLQTPLRIDADFKWYKTSEDLFIEEIDNFEKDYRFEQNNDKVILDILKYDHSYHEQLSSYEPRVIGKNMAFCNVTILIPHGDDLILSKNKALVLQNLILKFGTRVKRDVNPIQSYGQNKIRFKRHDSTFVALEYVEGPIYFRKSLFAKSEEKIIDFKII